MTETKEKEKRPDTTVTPEARETIDKAKAEAEAAPSIEVEKQPRTEHMTQTNYGFRVTFEEFRYALNQHLPGITVPAEAHNFRLAAIELADGKDGVQCTYSTVGDRYADDVLVVEEDSE